MINLFEVEETNKMIEEEQLDVRTITLGISLLDCMDSDIDKLNRNVYKKITETARIRKMISIVISLFSEFEPTKIHISLENVARL